MRVPVFNQNGGGGKTATVVNPGTVLARQKKPALLIDLNPQTVCPRFTAGFGARSIKVDSICGKGPSVLKRQMARHYVLASYDRRRNMSSEILDHIRRKFGSDVCDLVITENVAVAEELSRCGFI